MPIPYDKANYPPGVIGVASSFLGRYREFDIDLARVYAPPGSLVQWGMGVNIAKNFNDAIRAMLADSKFQWVWILGDDHVFRQDTLMHLLSRGVDMITPLCLRRSEPYETVLHTCADDGYRLVKLENIATDTGLLDITEYTLGNAGTLLSRKLCETMAEPWFEVGRTHPEFSGSDLYFCEKVRRAGFKMYLDMDLTIGHLTHAAVWPVRKDGVYAPQVIGPGHKRSPAELVPYDADLDWKQIFNDYRANYDKLPFENHAALYEVVAKFFPDQRQYNLEEVIKFLITIPNARVLELGGWKGELAEQVLGEDAVEVTSWDNFEICKTAVETGFKGKGYVAHRLDEFFQPNGDNHNVLILSHVLEHMKFKQFQELLAGLDSVQHIYIDAPIQANDADVDWTDYMGTHVLEVGWESVIQTLRDRGFALTDDAGNIKCFRKVVS